MNRIKDLREARGWTQTQLGKLVGVERTTISNYEREDRQLTTSAINQFCDLFDVSADFLIGRSTRPEPIIRDADAELLRIYHNELPPDVRSIVDDILDRYRPAKKEKTGS